MASDEIYRAWFPEMLEELKSQWREDIEWSEVTPICHAMTDMREMLRQNKNIKLPLMDCPNCKKKVGFKLAPITIRSLLFALKKVKVINAIELTSLDDNWKKFQRKNKLNGQGDAKVSKLTKKSRGST